MKFVHFSSLLKTITFQKLILLLLSGEQDLKGNLLCWALQYSHFQLLLLEDEKKVNFLIHGGF
jgi:hypothetical protein